MENGSQILHQRAEVHPAVGGEIKENFGVVEGLLHAHQLHIQLVFLDLPLADLESVLFESLVIRRVTGVLRSSDADDLLERGSDQVVVHLTHPGNDLAVFQTPGRFHDHEVPGHGPEPAGIKIVQLSGIFEPDAYDCRHLFCSSNIVIISWSTVDCQFT